LSEAWAVQGRALGLAWGGQSPPSLLRPVTEVLLLSLQIVLNVALPAWVVRRDQRRLRPEQLARTWNDASFWAAVVAFGPLCVPVHFAKARQSLGGLCLGLGWMTAATLVIWLIGRFVSAWADILT
jgi:hypothetical protein